MSKNAVDHVVDNVDDRPETVVVLRSVHARSYHRPDPQADDPRPLCECKAQHSGTWVEWPVEQAEAWREPCRECFPGE